MTDGGAWQTAPQPFVGHQQSVEDLQWSPTEDTVFASCSADQTVKIWDTRAPKRPCLSLHAHQSDVNVISWNRIVSYLLASGSDEGVFSVWDLRSLQQQSQSKQPTPAASFKWHNGPISSLEWHPTDESVLAVSGRDDQMSIWDFSVEQDREEADDPDAPDVPPQLMFIHQGQSDIKEVHWHRQIPGVLVSTAATGFNFFKTISV
jgi:ribosome assembly protein RRB1